MMLTDIEKKIIGKIQGDLPICERPYQKIAKDLAISEDELIKILKNLDKKGFIRRFGATLKHQKSGFSANAMVAWQVDENRIDEVGGFLSGLDEITHCYRRNPSEEWPYNFYTMIHAASKEACHQLVEKISQKIKVSVFQILFSQKELKKTSMQYF
jgi:siroheme decarboxylase